MNARSETDAGFTIVETLIFLAISGLMFVLAISAMSGKQQQTEFQTGADNFSSELNEDLSDVSDGNYPFTSNVYCSADASGGVPYFNSDDNSPDGSCTVIGEIIAFNDAPGQEDYVVFPVIGRSYVAPVEDVDNPEIATDITQAEPQISDAVGHYQAVVMPESINIVPTATTTLKGAFGIFSFTSFEGTPTTPTVNQLTYGSSHVEIFSIPDYTFSSSLVTSEANIVAAINGTSDGGEYLSNCSNNPNYVYIGSANYQCSVQPLPSNEAPINPSAGVTFCVNSGTTDNESALFTIGGINSPTTATYKIYSSQGC